MDELADLGQDRFTSIDYRVSLYHWIQLTEPFNRVACVFRF
jgi:hypothetical protein